MKNILDYFFWTASLFPFISPIPLATDLQPIAGAMSLMIIGRSAFKGDFKFDISTTPIFIFFLYSSIFLMIDSLGENFNFSKHFSFIYGLIVFLACKYTCPYPYKIFSYSLIIYFSLCIISYIIPDYYYQLQQFIVNTRVEGMSYEFYTESARGASILAPEPSFYGAILAFLLLSNQMFYDSNQQNITKFWINLSMIFIQIILNKSGTGLLFFAIYAFFILIVQLSFKAKIRLISIITIVIVFLFSQYNIDINELQNFGRSLDLAIKLLDQDYDALTNDASMGTRATDFLIGFLGLIEHPFGVGIGGVKNLLIHLNEQYNLNLFMLEDREGVATSLSYGLLAFGFPFLFLISYIYISSKVSLLFKIFSFLFMSLSVSFGFPPIWILLSEHFIHQIPSTDHESS